MLERTFVHIPGLNLELERSLWDRGCFTWQDWLDHQDEFACEGVETRKFVSNLKRSFRAKEAGEHQYFRKKLGSNYAWRAFPDFKQSCVYLDIETDGTSGPGSITTVGLYDGKRFRVLVKNEDLGNFPDVISQYSMIVTFYGTGFDLPILQKRFPLTRMDQIHLDLCPILKKLGHSGGLKKIEQALGIARSEDTVGLTGFDAVKLWRQYVRFGDSSALDRLVAYNREDVVNLEFLAEYAYSNLWRLTFGERSDYSKGRLTGGTGR